MDGEAEPSDEKRGRCSTVADWFSLLRRRGTRVTGGGGFKSGIAFVVVYTQDHGAVVLDVEGELGGGVMVFVDTVGVRVLV